LVEAISETGATRESSDPQAILGALEAIVYDWDVASDRLRWGPNAARVLRGLAATDVGSGADFAALVAPESEISRYQAIFEGDTVDSGEGAPYRAQYRLRAADGEVLRVEDFGRWFADTSGRPARAHGLLRVVARIAAAEAQEEAQTTLASRSAFNAFVDARCAEPRPAEGALALMVFGVANLAEINAAAGYDAADELIAGVGRTLSRTLRGGDRLVRYSGGKFALLIALAAKDQPGVAAARIAHRAEGQVHKTVAGPLSAKIRVGVAVSPRHGRSAHLLLQRADEAYAQTQDSARVAVYALNAAAAETRRRDAFVADEIVSALNDRRLILAFQPVAPTADLPPFEEALVRLRMEDGALIGADAMIPAAERVGLVEMIDERVADLVAAALAADPQRRLSMNVSVTSLRSPDWCDRLRARLTAAPGSAERLIVEIVETQAVENAGELAEILKRIKGLGVRVAMDDFGAGHTSFRNLRSLGVDMVKIDGAFVAGLATSVDDRFFVRTLASLARHLGIQTVAEWVEDEESVRLLREWGVDYLQGHHIGRAATPDQAPVRASA
jgi:diguanylate cyclase (GGDEF)-like protein